MRESLSGSVILKEPKQYPRHLPRPHHRLPSKQRTLLTRLHQNLAPQKPNVAS